MLPREFPSQTLQNAALNLLYQEEPINASFFRFTDNKKKKHSKWQGAYKDVGSDLLNILGRHMYKETDENVCKLLLR